MRQAILAKVLVSGARNHSNLLAELGQIIPPHIIQLHCMGTYLPINTWWPGFGSRSQAETGQPAYRGKQLYDAILKGATKVEDVANVPLAWRQQLKAQGVRCAASSCLGVRCNAPVLICALVYPF